MNKNKTKKIQLTVTANTKGGISTTITEKCGCTVERDAVTQFEKVYPCKMHDTWARFMDVMHQVFKDIRGETSPWVKVDESDTPYALRCKKCGKLDEGVRSTGKATPVGMSLLCAKCFYSSPDIQI